MAYQRRETGTGGIELVVYDQEEQCPYLPDETARMPLRYFAGPGPLDFDRSLAAGDRRAGQLLYRPTCPTCTACEGIRVLVDEFRPSRSQSRCWNKNQDLQIVIAPPVFTEDRLQLFNRHKTERKLGAHVMDQENYEGWFMRTCTRTVELSLWRDGQLVGATILDLGKHASSAVYGYFDPKQRQRSLGVFMVLASIAWAKQQGFQYHYLGLYIEKNAHVNYKANYLPHERQIHGQWIRFSK